jgi:hypothetical protein
VSYGDNFRDLAPIQLDADEAALEALWQMAEAADIAGRLLQSGDLAGCVHQVRRLSAFYVAAIGTLKLIAEREASRRTAEPERLK